MFFTLLKAEHSFGCVQELMGCVFSPSSPTDDDKSLDDLRIIVDHEHSEDTDDMFKSYAEIAKEETRRRTSHIDPSNDLLSNWDASPKHISSHLDNSVHGKINSEESAEYIISFWCRHFPEPVSIPCDIYGVAAKYIDITYRSQWSSTAKGNDFQIDVLNRCKVSIPKTFAPKQAIRSAHCCPRGKVSVFYITCLSVTEQSWNGRNDNFIGIVSEFESAFNIPCPLTGYGISFGPNQVVRGNRYIAAQRRYEVHSGRKVKCVVDLREDKYKLYFHSTRNIVPLPKVIEGTPVEEVRWYPCIAGDFRNLECLIEFEEPSKKSIIDNLDAPDPYNQVRRLNKRSQLLTQIRSH